MKTDNDTMTGAERLVLAAGAGLLPFFLFGTCGWASMPDATSGEPSLPSVKMVPKKLALFKNGYGTVTLEGKTAEGSSMELAGLPTPSYGSFWLSAEQGVSVRELISSKVKEIIPKPEYGRNELLAANAGKLIKITTTEGGMIVGRMVKPVNNKVRESNRPNLMGSLSSPVEDGRDMNRSSFAMAGSLLMQTETGHVVLQEAAVQQVEFLEKESSFPTWTTDRTRLVMNLEKPAPGKTVTVNSLSSGISWLPTYRVELGAEGHAQLQCKATIMNELMDLEKVDMELISGFPRLAMPGLPSPISMKQNMSALFAALGSEKPGTEYARSLMDNYMSQARTPQPVFTMEKATAIDPGTVKQAEDLFFYSLPDFSCKYRETVTRNLFGGDVPYRHIYTWDIPNQKGLSEWNQNRDRGAAVSPLDVWHCIQLTNGLNLPWSTGMVEFVSQGRLAGQSTLTFTNPGERVLVRLNKSMETMVHVSEETLSSEPVKVRSSSYQKYTVKGTLTMRNVSGRNMEFQVNKNIIGTPETVSGEGEMSSLPNWNRSLNPDGKFQWKLTLKPDEKKDVEYQYTYLD